MKKQTPILLLKSHLSRRIEIGKFMAAAFVVSVLSACAIFKPPYYPPFDKEKLREVIKLIEQDQRQQAVALMDTYRSEVSKTDNVRALAELDLAKGQILMLNIRPGMPHRQYQESIDLMLSAAATFEELDLGYQAGHAYNSVIRAYTRGRDMKTGCAYLENAIDAVESATDEPASFPVPAGQTPEQLLQGLIPKCEVISFDHDYR